MVTDTHAKNQVNVYKHLEKKSGKLLKFTTSKARIFTKNRWSITKLKLNLQVMVTDLHAKIQVNIYKCFEKKSGKPFDR